MVVRSRTWLPIKNPRNSEDSGVTNQGPQRISKTLVIRCLNHRFGQFCFSMTGDGWCSDEWCLVISTGAMGDLMVSSLGFLLFGREFMWDKSLGGMLGAHFVWAFSLMFVFRVWY